MSLRMHDRVSFFKYYTITSAQMTLINKTRKWSTPSLFNDPFDNQFDLRIPELSENLIEGILSRILELSRNEEEIDISPSINKKLTVLRQIHSAFPKIRFSDTAMDALRQEIAKGIERSRQAAPSYNAEIRKIMADTSIFCVSETNDNLLMWSHYAQNHSGVVIEFLAHDEIDSPLLVARPVHYSRDVPHLNITDIIDVNDLANDVRDKITLTKSEDWSYEREWRIVAGLRDKSSSHEMMPYSEHEVSAVYLGCRIASCGRDKIFDIIRREFPWAKVFQARKHSNRFAIEFSEESI